MVSRSYFAYAMANMMDGYEEQVATVKEGLFGRLFAQPNIRDILEVGIGAGPNFRFYPADLIKVCISLQGVHVSFYNISLGPPVSGYEIHRYYLSSATFLHLGKR